MKVSAMKTYKDFIIYKGQDKEVQIPFAVSGFTDFTASFYTDKEYEILKTAEDFDFDGEWASIFFDNTALDLLNNGVLRYTFNYKIDGVDVVKSTNSAYTLRTPENYSAHTADEIYTEGYSSGYTDGMVSGTSVGYEEGFEEGEEAQKAKMTGATITENGTYTRPDGYSSVDVNVDQVGPYNSGYTSGYTDGYGYGYTSGSTDGYNEGYPIGYASGVTDGINAVPLQEKNFSPNVFVNDYYPDNGYSGMSVIHFDAQAWLTPYEEEAWRQGEHAQKDRLSGITITENGSYTRENGYSAVTVNVPTGSTIHNQNKSITANTNGHQVVTFDSGYTGLGTVDLNINVPTSGTSEPYFGKIADFTGVKVDLVLDKSEGSYIEVEYAFPESNNYGVVAKWSIDGDIYSWAVYNTLINTDTKAFEILVQEDGVSGYYKDEFVLNVTKNKVQRFRALYYKYYVNGNSAATVSYSATVAKAYSDDSYLVGANLTSCGVEMPVTACTSTNYNHMSFFNNNVNTSLPCYVKSIIFYNASTGVKKHVVPRSDGKMWDLVSNQETDIVFDKYDGTHPTTFNTLYEWEIS